MKRIIVSAGGTGGHVFPALAIARELIKNKVMVHFIGNRGGMEELICRREGLEFSGLDVQKLYRRISFAQIKFPFKLTASLIRAGKIITAFSPDLVLGTGGFASGPAGLAAAMKKLPLFLQEQNSYPGITNRFLGRFAEKVFLGNAGAAEYFPGGKILFSGNPVRSDIKAETNKIPSAETGLETGSFKLLLIGGSQGSRSLNNSLLPILDELKKENIEILWQTGKTDYRNISEKLKTRKGIWVFDFWRDMGKLYNTVDAAIARAGALTLAELEVKKIPSILIPLPSAAGNHQFFNAEEFVSKGQGILLEQKDLNPASLLNSIIRIKSDIESFRAGFGESPHLNAVETIVRHLMRKLENRG